MGGAAAADEQIHDILRERSWDKGPTAGYSGSQRLGCFVGDNGAEPALTAEIAMLPCCPRRWCRRHERGLSRALGSPRGGRAGEGGLEWPVGVEEGYGIGEEWREGAGDGGF